MRFALWIFKLLFQRSFSIFLGTLWKSSREQYSRYVALVSAEIERGRKCIQTKFTNGNLFVDKLFGKPYFIWAIFSNTRLEGINIHKNSYPRRDSNPESLGDWSTWLWRSALLVDVAVLKRAVFRDSVVICRSIWKMEQLFPIPNEEQARAEILESFSTYVSNI